VLVVVLWFETQASSRDRYLLIPALVSLAIPQLVIGGGQYSLFLALGIEGTATGLFIAHFTPVMAYVAIVLAGPWRGFDNRYMAAARALSSSPLRNVLRIKLPMLKASLLTAAAVGFGVSMVQFVPAQLAAAGRYSTLPMEAVTLTSGGNRSLTAAYALALAIPPLLVFLASGLLGRPRWR
jgi:putative thiamine transport system permease protein